MSGSTFSGPIDITPEEFRKRLHQKSSTPDRKRNRCPHCGGDHIRAKSARGADLREHPEDYMCSRCGAHFDRPVRGQSR